MGGDGGICPLVSPMWMLPVLSLPAPPRARLHARAGDADGAAGGDAVEEELLHGVVVEGAYLLF